MQYRKFGNTDLVVSEVGFGAWAIGGGAMIGNTSIGWGDVDDDISRKAILAALDAGVNFFDTADIYGLGHSEELLGSTIGKDAKIVIATKVGNVARNGQFSVDYSKDHIMGACERSLKRLNRETIDYYQLHSARMNHLQDGECVEAMQQLQTAGKIRYWGLSLNTFDPFPEADFLVQKKWANGFQLVLNILNQRALPVLKLANENGYGVIARMPLQFGLLTGKFNTSSIFPVNDHRRNRLTREVISAAEKVLSSIWELCNKYKTTKSQLALSYVLSHPQVSTVIPGIRTAEQVEQNTKYLTKLEDKDMKMIEDLEDTRLASVMDLIQQRG